MVGTKIVINCVMKMGIHFEFEEKSMETETQHDQNFPQEGNHCRTNTRVRSRKEIQKSRAVLVSQRSG